MLLRDEVLTSEIWSGCMPRCEIELGLHGADLESGLRDRMNGDLDGCRLNCPKKDCHANVGEHDLVRHVRWSRGG